jgi:hypothetical protein
MSDPSELRGYVRNAGFASHREGVIDWRTVDPETFKGSVLAEELRTYAEHLDELLERAEGRYVLIVGREIIRDFDHSTKLGDVALEAHHQFPGRPVLIKKVAAFEPIHTLGGVVPAIEEVKG